MKETNQQHVKCRRCEFPAKLWKGWELCDNCGHRHQVESGNHDAIPVAESMPDKTKTPTPELLPCPFCNGEVRETMTFGMMVHIGDYDCPFGSSVFTIGKWNRRVAPPAAIKESLTVQPEVTFEKWWNEIELIGFAARKRWDAHDSARLAEITRLEAKVSRLRGVLEGVLNRYVGLVESGDSGNWDAEKEDDVIAARAALAPQAPASPADTDKWPLNNPKAMASINRGLAEVERGEITPASPSGSYPNISVGDDLSPPGTIRVKPSRSPRADDGQPGWEGGSMNEVKLKPCPFCGALVKRVVLYGIAGIEHPATSDCGLKHMRITEAYWNDRAPDAAGASGGGREWLVVGRHMPEGYWIVEGPPTGPDKFYVREVLPVASSRPSDPTTSLQFWEVSNPEYNDTIPEPQPPDSSPVEGGK